MRSWISLAILFVLVAGLGAWVYYRPSAPATQAHALSELKPSEIRRIRVERATAAEMAPSAVPPTAGESAATPSQRVELERRGESWYVTAPFPARANALQVERLLAMLDARSVARYPATDLARYALDRPAVTLTFEDQSFSLGGINATTREQYVLTRDGVYAIPVTQQAVVPSDLNALVSRDLFAPGEAPVRFELEEFTASLEEGIWKFAPLAEEPGPDERNGWVAAWRQASAVRAARHDGGKPVATVTIALKDGRTITLGILQREPELVLVRSDEGIQYHFFADTGKRLLRPPGDTVKK